MSNDLSSYVQYLKENTNMVDVVSEYVELTQKGTRYWGLCPFHQEKTPSFVVYTKNNHNDFFKCFGCGAGGDVITFVEMIEHVSFPRAMLILGDKFGLDRPVDFEFSETLAENYGRYYEEDYEVLGRARNFYHNALKIARWGSEGMRYLEARGISAEMIERYEIGYAPDSWDKMMTSFEEKGYGRDLLKRVGLVSQSQKNETRYYDRFRRRVMIPIKDERGRVVGFGGRAIDDSVPKYLNTSETEVFHKGRVLYGLDVAKRAINREKYAIICEGYMDAIRVSSVGIANVVATLGTALTEDQVKLLCNYTNQVYLCYDNDSAGVEATVRAIEMLRKKGMRVRVIELEGAKDPDEYIKKEGKEGFEKRIECAKSGTEYEIARELGLTKDLKSIEGRVGVLRKILPILEREGNVERREYIKKLSTKLMIEEGTIMEEYERLKRGSREEESKERERGGAIIEGGRYIIAMILSAPEMLENVKEVLPCGLRDEVQREIMEKLEGEREELSREAAAELEEIKRMPIENKVQAYQDSLYRLRLEYLRDEKRARLREGEYEAGEKIQKEINELKREYSR